MFSLEGPARSPGQNRALAALLSIIAGYVNAAGFVLVNSFTSHVTGSAGRFANNLVQREYLDAVSALLLVLAFFLGAFTANTLLLTRFVGRRPFIYAALLALESMILMVFVFVAHAQIGDAPTRSADAKAAMLCFAMGLQNSLVTVISDARVRTTHLTGVVTDLGIEAARWLRFLMGRASGHVNNELARPQPQTSALLLTIFLSFLLGAALGAELATQSGASAMYAPSLAALIAAGFATWAGLHQPDAR